MRIFSIHKSKSKRQISEKTPKLAANKFLEKRKVGTVIYLHEHPSRKVHGPYQKEYNKKIMKGGLSIEDFRVDRYNFQGLASVLNNTSQLLIKQTNVGFFREPRLFFGNNKNKYRNHDYFTFVCKNKDKINPKYENLIVFRKLTFIENSNDTITPTITPLNDKDVKEIPKEILLGFYYQYIERVKLDFQNTSQRVQLKDIFMKKLFIYLLLNIFPVITEHILTKYVKEQNKSRGVLILKYKECEFYFSILEFIKRLSLGYIIDEFFSICKIPFNLREKLKGSILDQLDNKIKSLPNQEQFSQIRQNITKINEGPDVISEVQRIAVRINNETNSSSNRTNLVPFGTNIYATAISGTSIFDSIQFCAAPFKLILDIIGFFLGNPS